jgi:hypothetical protein
MLTMALPTMGFAVVACRLVWGMWSSLVSGSSFPYDSASLCFRSVAETSVERHACGGDCCIRGDRVSAARLLV